MSGDDTGKFTARLTNEEVDYKALATKIIAAKELAETVLANAKLLQEADLPTEMQRQIDHVFGNATNGIFMLFDEIDENPQDPEHVKAAIEECFEIASVSRPFDVVASTGAPFPELSYEDNVTCLVKRVRDHIDALDEEGDLPVKLSNLKNGFAQLTKDWREITNDLGLEFSQSKG